VKWARLERGRSPRANRPRSRLASTESTPPPYEPNRSLTVKLIKSKYGLNLGRVPTATDSLREHGLHVTPQRLAVLAAVEECPHATADQVLESVRANIGSISRQSVYDSLTTLSEAGILRRVQPAGSATRYESRAGDNHHHIVCRSCGELADVDCAVGDTPCLTASNDQGFAIDEAEVVYWGQCPTCSTEQSTSLT
jgi:Fur family ferric uptake transcriptional regulator